MFLLRVDGNDVTLVDDLGHFDLLDFILFASGYQGTKVLVSKGHAFGLSMLSMFVLVSYLIPLAFSSHLFCLGMLVGLATVDLECVEDLFRRCIWGIYLVHQKPHLRFDFGPGTFQMPQIS